MRTLISIAPLACVLAVSAAIAATAPPAELNTMRTAFAAALAAKDIKTLAKMSSFPLAIVVYQMPPSLTEKDFLKSKGGDLDYADAGEQHCIAHDAPELQDAKSASDKRFANAWAVNCDGNIFYFAQRKGAWLYIGYENINE